MFWHKLGLHFEPAW